jgi:hypothetical protein
MMLLLSGSNSLTPPLLKNPAPARQKRIFRRWADERGVVPLFHYTSVTVVSLILKSGLRMSTQV